MIRQLFDHGLSGQYSLADVGTGLAREVNKSFVAGSGVPNVLVCAFL
jgi:hypothetical protein